VVVSEPTQPGARPKPLWVRFELVTPYRWFQPSARDAVPRSVLAFAEKRER